MAPRVEAAWLPTLPARIPWVPTALGSGLALAAVWTVWDAPTFPARLVRDAFVFFAVPVGLALAARRDIGFRVDRRAIASALALTALVLPFYVVGSSIPTVRAHYPMGPTSTAAGDFLPHAAMVLGLVVATETFYRGLLCVGIRQVGPVAILVSPTLYAVQHLASIPIEFLLSAPADALFGAADYYSESLLPSVVAHGTGILVLEWLVMHPPVVSPARVAELLRWLPVAL